MKIGIVGSRRRNSPEDKALVKKFLLELEQIPSEIISGGCKLGADRFAEELAAELHLPITIHYPKLKPGMAKWECVREYFARNYLIAEGCDILLAVVASDRTGGAENTVTRAKKLGREIILL